MQNYKNNVDSAKNNRYANEFYLTVNQAIKKPLFMQPILGVNFDVYQSRIVCCGDEKPLLLIHEQLDFLNWRI